MPSPSLPPPPGSGKPPTFAAVRAAFTQAAITAADELDVVSARRIRGAIDPASLERITSAGRLEWLPIELDMRVTEAITLTLGPRRCAEFWRKSLLDTFETPILKPILEGAVNLFGPTPEGMIRWTPRVWDALYRNCGAMTVLDREPGSAKIACEPLARPLITGTAFVEALRASLEVVFVLGRVKGEARIAELSPEDRRVVYALTWTPR